MSEWDSSSTAGLVAIKETVHDRRSHNTRYIMASAASGFFASFVALLVTWQILTCASAPATVDTCISPAEFDFIVVGAGSSGSVVASRLSEDPNFRVLVLEAGGEPVKETEAPLLYFKLFSTDMLWGYRSEKQSNCCLAYIDQITKLPSGKGLGGTGSINNMLHTRASIEDYNGWGVDNPGWSYEDVKKYFIEMESYEILQRREDMDFHGSKGPMTVTTPEFRTQMGEAFLQAGRELNYNQVDVNAQYQTGFTAPPMSIKNGTRWSSYKAFLEPARQRPNLVVATNALVLKVKFDERNVAVGVEYERNGVKCKATVRKEVILSAGALRSPHLLMLSGIGPAKELKKFNIPVIANLPGVGQNLEDHVIILGIEFTLDIPVGFNKKRYLTAEYQQLWEDTRTGPFTVPGVEGLAFFDNSNSFPEHANFEISFVADKSLSSVNLSPNYKDALIIDETKDVITFIPIVLRPKSRGTITLKSNDSHDFPYFNPRYLSDPADVKLAVEAVKTAIAIGNTTAFKKYGAKLIGYNKIPGCENLIHGSDAFWECYVKRFSNSGYHFTSSCKMAPKSDPMGVVDEFLRVRGVSGLRIADASIMPHVPSGHTHVPCTMIGEKASKMIRNHYRNISEMV